MLRNVAYKPEASSKAGRNLCARAGIARQRAIDRAGLLETAFPDRQRRLDGQGENTPRGRGRHRPINGLTAALNVFPCSLVPLFPWGHEPGDVAGDNHFETLVVRFADATFSSARYSA